MSVDQLLPIPAWARSGLPAIIVDVGRVGDVSVVRVAGAVDMMTISPVKVELMRAVMGATTAVVVDLNGVSFFSCGGLQMLVEAREVARACQVRLCLAVQCRAVLRPMELSGLLDVFHVLPSVSCALADCR
ncbi:STAS domain-containing protein [Kutzneria sp. 744]|jgi:anti-sigma B factor antagonist|uniref:STAS domain-containing protein n=1 Tax=Kutzneria sp. (strain 744) TaxID=345341 RepID=UPI0003EEAC46|nr:STAS domain-containing protein [Kutzneria sp. 744]EWM12138.1 STAS domain-containing protein [Kutzneria sp. 744]